MLENDREMNWEERKVIDAEPYIYARKIKETSFNKLHQGVNIVNTVYPNGNKANFRVKTIYSGKRSIHFAR